MTRKAFTLIETLVAVGVLAVLMVTVGGILLMSIKSKNSTEVNELMSSRAVFILGELKKNVLDAELGQINCPVDIGNSISFMTKSGGVTTLLCDEVSGQIASVSASGSNNFLDEKVRAQKCNDFVWCDLSSDSKVLSIGFSLNLLTGDSGEVGNSGIYYGTVVPRE
jgi:prepilin-type N-terminal cleavage/methylation domain-containing protein